MALTAYFPSMLAARLLLGLALLAGAPGGMPTPGDPARAAALAAGALCLGDGPAGLPQDGQRHDHCLICLAGTPLGGLVSVTPSLFYGGSRVFGGGAMAPSRIGEAGRAGYAPRAPPRAIG